MKIIIPFNKLNYVKEEIEKTIRLNLRPKNLRPYKEDIGLVLTNDTRNPDFLRYLVKK